MKAVNPTKTSTNNAIQAYFWIPRIARIPKIKYIKEWNGLKESHHIGCPIVSGPDFLKPNT